jgi:hypothetical protein
MFQVFILFLQAKVCSKHSKEESCLNLGTYAPVSRRFAPALAENRRWPRQSRG